MIDLGQARCIGAGYSRACYLHPLDPTKVIKVPRDVGNGERQNRIDRYYLGLLERRGVPTDHVPRQHGMVATTLGDGLVLDFVSDGAGEPAPTLGALLKSGRLPRAEALAALDETFRHFLEHGVVLADVGLLNFVCRREGARWVLVAIDGLGGRHFDFKLVLRARFPVLARWKLRAQWRLLREAVEGCLARR